MEILSGESKIGAPIRNELQAFEVGYHLPHECNFLVVWGTITPETVGVYRPRLTYVQKSKDERALATHVTYLLDAKNLPLPTDHAASRREYYKRLLGATCASVPQYSAIHDLGRERTPELSSFYALAGKDNSEITSIMADVEKLSTWTRLKQKNHLDHYRRVSEIDVAHPYPTMIYNDKDGSLMVLITDGNDQPKLFKNDTGIEEIVYIDASETTNRQAVAFLNAKGNRKVGGVAYVFS